MKINLPRKWRRQTPVFMVGLGLFALGVLGFMFEAWQGAKSQLPRQLSDRVVFMAQVSSESLAELDEQNLDLFLPDWLNLEDFNEEGLQDWVGSEVGVAAVDDKHFVLGARYRSKSAVKTWLKGQLLPDEDFTITQTDKGEVWSPSFSSQQVFLIAKDWLFVADSLVTLQATLSDGKTLTDNDRYQEAFDDLKPGKAWRFYVDLESFFADWQAPESLAVYKPLLTAAGQTMPALAMTAEDPKEGIRGVALQWLLSDTAMDQIGPENISRNSTIPDLAHYAPNDVLFFINGQDLYTRYQNTKALLESLNPQFGLIFDGVLRAQVGRWFGTEADLELDILAAIKGPYALVLDQKDDELEWLFVTKSQVGESLEDLIRTAQGKFSPAIEEVELPDGTTREELVATPPEKVRLNEVTRRGWTYTVSQSSSLSQKNLAFMQSGEHFLIASSSDTLEAALEAQKNDQTSLANNSDFRQAVLYRLGQAESFGFVNMNKLRQLGLPLMTIPVYEADDEEAAEPMLTWWQQALTWPVRNVVFSRRINDEAVIMNSVLFGQ